MSIAHILNVHAGVAHHSAFERAGIERRELLRAVHAGEVLRVRNGWFAGPSAPRDVVRAVRVGGALTGASTAQLYELWTIADPLLHVRVRSTTGRLRSPEGAVALDRRRDKVCVHYRHDRVETAADPLIRGLAEMFTCSDETAAIVALDSALNSRKRSLRDVPELKRLTLPSRHPLIDKADAGSQSGLETIARLLMRRNRVQFRTQVQIDGVGRVDLLIGDRLVVELDGFGLHADRFEQDRERDWKLTQHGYLVVRISYRMLMFERARVEAGLLALVRRGAHRRAA